MVLLSIKRFYPWLLLYIVGLYAGQVLTVDPPNGSRALIILPVIYLFIGIGLHTVYTKIPLPRKMRLIIMLALTAVISMIEITTYFHWMSWITLR